jgi:aspartyl-tRNA(Asn)/glutamyl-tRNA(Gln) amidotransferase subunit C
MLNSNDVSYIAALARIHVPPSELEGFKQSLGNIISYVDQLNELNVEGVEPTSHVLHLKNVYRPDIIKPSLPHNEALGASIDKHQGSFKVPRVIE